MTPREIRIAEERDVELHKLDVARGNFHLYLSRRHLGTVAEGTPLEAITVAIELWLDDRMEEPFAFRPTPGMAPPALLRDRHEREDVSVMSGGRVVAIVRTLADGRRRTIHLDRDDDPRPPRRRFALKAPARSAGPR